VLGGEKSIDNLRAFGAVAGVRFLGEIATQLHNLPGGTRVNLEVIE